ncbi:MAG: sulfatase-like hydrolase/transferase [Pirellulales bacterium]|nr:sulfatase-like hydrolase/transferase [Pirellulales bacterium]
MTKTIHTFSLSLALSWVASVQFAMAVDVSTRPNIVLVMSDDQGWGETGYNGHPHLQTPVLDEMARTGLRLDRFYAGSPICSSTRATVMTGRNANRSGAFSWNWSIRPEETTIAQVLKGAGYRTAHFGKWHIGAVKKGSPLSPNNMGFDQSLSHDNFFEMNPKLSRNGAPPELLEGEGSEVVVAAALQFARKVHAEKRPFFMVIWFGSPHDPYSGLKKDVDLYKALGGPIGRRFAEISAMDRAIGTLRDGLEELNVRSNTLLWFNSDNGITHEGIADDQKKDLYNGRLRGTKGQLFEGGLLVPCIIEWPEVIKTARTSDLPAVTSDIFPTLLDLLRLPHPHPDRPLDGVSLKELIVDDNLTERSAPIGYWWYPMAPERKNEPWISDDSLNEMITMTARQRARQARGEYNKPDHFMNFRHPVATEKDFRGEAALTGNRYKLIVDNRGQPQQLYDLVNDREEKKNLVATHPEVVGQMQQQLEAWRRSVEYSLTGRDFSASQ